MKLYSTLQHFDFKARGVVVHSLLFGSVISTFGQTPPKPVPTTGQSAVAVHTTFAEAIKKSVAYLQTDCTKTDGTTASYEATGFFVAKPDERLGKNSEFVYLVTNRHAAQPGIEDGTPCHVSNYWIRLNVRAAVPSELPRAMSFPLGPNVPWVYPDDPAVDLAIVPLAPSQSKIDYEPIPSTMFATDDVVKTNMISEGDSVIFTGLFVQMPGLFRLEPIVREGTIAMIPSEPIMTTLKRPGNLYLADVHVFGGNSGSPMFVNLGGVRNGQLSFGASYKLLGIVSGYEFEDTDFNLQAATTYAGKLGANSGVTSVVPAEELDKLINCPKLQAMRDAEVAKAIRK